MSDQKSSKNLVKDGMTVVVTYEKDSDIEKVANQAIRNFTRKVRNNGILQELYERRHYEKPSQKRRKKHLRAVRMNWTEDTED